MAERENGVERLRRWTDEQRGVPPAFGRMRAHLDEVATGRTTVRLPLVPELLLPDGSPSCAVTSMLADFGLASCVIASLPDLRGVATISLTVDHLEPPPSTGALVATCSTGSYAGGHPQHAAGTVQDDSGRVVARISGWLLPTPAEPAGMERIGLAEEPAASDVCDLLQVPFDSAFEVTARDALSNAIGSLHGGIGALACSLAAEAALPEMRPLTAAIAFLRPMPRAGGVVVRATVAREGRRTGVTDTAVTDADGRLLVTSRAVHATA